VSPIHQDEPVAISKQVTETSMATEEPNPLSTHIVIPRHRDTTIPSNHATVIPQPQADDTIEQVRRAVRELGKEAATHRFTLDEKIVVREISHTYQKRGIKTSENEITRIALNYLLADYQQQGENSILEKVLQELNK